MEYGKMHECHMNKLNLNLKLKLKLMEVDPLSFYPSYKTFANYI